MAATMNPSCICASCALAAVGWSCCYRFTGDVDGDGDHDSGTSLSSSETETVEAMLAPGRDVAAEVCVFGDSVSAKGLVRVQRLVELSFVTSSDVAALSKLHADDGGDGGAADDGSGDDDAANNLPLFFVDKGGEGGERFDDSDFDDEDAQPAAAGQDNDDDNDDDDNESGDDGDDDSDGRKAGDVDGGRVLGVTAGDDHDDSDDGGAVGPTRRSARAAVAQATPAKGARVGKTASKSARKADVSTPVQQRPAPAPAQTSTKKRTRASSK